MGGASRESVGAGAVVRRSGGLVNASELRLAPTPACSIITGIAITSFVTTRTNQPRTFAHGIAEASISRSRSSFKSLMDLELLASLQRDRYLQQPHGAARIPSTAGAREVTLLCTGIIHDIL